MPRDSLESSFLFCCLRNSQHSRKLVNFHRRRISSFSIIFNFHSFEVLFHLIFAYILESRTGKYYEGIYICILNIFIYISLHLSLISLVSFALPKFNGEFSFELENRSSSRLAESELPPCKQDETIQDSRRNG